MRTSKLNSAEKSYIVNEVLNRTSTITELANLYHCHPRTVYRALEEAGLGTAQTDRKMPAGKKALEILAKHNVSIDHLEGILIQANSFTIPKAPRPPSKDAALFRPAATVN